MDKNAYRNGERFAISDTAGEKPMQTVSFDGVRRGHGCESLRETLVLSDVGEDVPTSGATRGIHTHGAGVFTSKGTESRSVSCSEEERATEIARSITDMWYFLKCALPKTNGSGAAFSAADRHGRMANINKANTSETEMPRGERKEATRKGRRYHSSATDQHVSRSEAVPSRRYKCARPKVSFDHLRIWCKRFRPSAALSRPYIAACEAGLCLQSLSPLRPFGNTAIILSTYRWKRNLTTEWIYPGNAAQRGRKFSANAAADSAAAALYFKNIPLF